MLPKDEEIGSEIFKITYSKVQELLKICSANFRTEDSEYNFHKTALIHKMFIALTWFLFVSRNVSRYKLLHYTLKFQPTLQS